MLSKSICIATPDVIGPVRNGGIGSACFEIAKTWSKAGHDVTVLFVNFAGFSESQNDDWREMYDDLGISFVICPPDLRPGVPGPLQLAWNAWQWLKGRGFDAIYFPEWRAIGLYTIQAKQSGLDFQETQMIVGAHSPTLWHSSGGMQFPKSFDDVLTDAAERQAVAFADMLISPSQYMIDYMHGEDWDLPKDVRMIPNPFSTTATEAQAGAVAATKTIHEIVFFGRLEQRKGLTIFIKALSQLPDNIARSLRVTFLGKAGDFPGGALKFICDSRLERFRDWRVIDDRDSHRALDYLSGSGRLAIMASLTENSPMTVRECIALRVPFLASDVGGIPELIAADDRESVLFRPTPATLAAAISRKVQTGATPVRSAFSEDIVTSAWRSVLSVGDSRVERSVKPEKVSVVVTTFNRPAELEEALDGLRLQTKQDFEVVLVDDGSTEPAAIAKIDSLEAEFDAKGWKIIRQTNSYLGAARNAGWRAASGDLVIFHDDDNYSSETLVETYFGAMATSGVDVATCTMAPYDGERPKTSSWDTKRLYAFVGNARGAGLYGNAFGDAHACFRRSALEKVGGFTEDYGIGHEDWEIFARASLLGLKILNVPEPLFWYHENDRSMLRSRKFMDPDFMRSLRPYLDAVPGTLRPALQLASRQFLTETTPQIFVQAPYGREEIITLGFSMLPRSLRSEVALRKACAGELSWFDPIRKMRFSLSEIAALRRLNKVGAELAESMELLDLIFAGLPRKLRSTKRILELAAFTQSWERIRWRHPLNLSYWQAVRRLQRKARKMPRK